jgi:DNA-binding NtrC family response regulator
MSPERKSILIVDDEEPIHKALKRTFRREPYDLVHAYDAAEAWGILEKHPDISAVLSDQYMPGMHGLDLLSEIRRRYPHLITILLTAQADLDLVIRAINEGTIHRFFTKPWDSEDLRQEIRQLVFGGRGGATIPIDVQAAERRLQEELLPERDSSGAFIIEAPDLE